MLFAANNRTGETAFFRAKSSMSGEGRDAAGSEWAMPALGDPRAAPKWLSSNDAGRVQTARYVQQDGLGAAPRVASAGQALWHPDVFDLEASGLCASHAAMHMQGSGSQLGRRSAIVASGAFHWSSRNYWRSGVSVWSATFLKTQQR